MKSLFDINPRNLEKAKKLLENNKSNEINENNHIKI